MLGWHFNPTPDHHCSPQDTRKEVTLCIASHAAAANTDGDWRWINFWGSHGVCHLETWLNNQNKVEVAHPPSFPLPSSNWRLRPRRPALNSMKATHMKAAPPYPMFFEICCKFTSEIILWQTQGLVFYMIFKQDLSLPSGS